MSRVNTRFGDYVSRRMRNQGLSGREVARRAADSGQEISLSTVQGASAGIVPGPEKVLALATVLQDDPNRLLGLAGWPFRFDPTVLREAEASEIDRRPLAAC